MRQITIQFEVPEEYEADYADVDAQLVFEDFFPSEVGFTVISDTAQPQNDEKTQ